MNTDLIIYSKLKKRDEEGLRLLYLHYSGSLFGIAFRILNSHSFAEDTLQKSFLKIWNHIDQYDEEKATLFTWMAKIVRNTAIDINRLQSFQKEKESVSYNHQIHNTKRSHQNTDMIDSLSLMDNLGEKYAFIMEHIYLLGYTQQELSVEFNIPLGTIKTRIKKALDILRTYLMNEEVLFAS